VSEAKTEKPLVSVEAALLGILALLADEREERIANDRDARRTEVILHEAGLSIGEVAALLDKNYETVKSAIRRGRGR
jgi:DNA-directed RNA polymerase specialized sigma24 family protein